MLSFFHPPLAKKPVLLRSTARAVTPFGGLVSLLASYGLKSTHDYRSATRPDDVA
jgi:hypothetical protein